MLPEEGRPVIVDQDAVGLEGIDDGFAATIALLKLNGFTLKRDAH